MDYEEKKFYEYVGQKRHEIDSLIDVLDISKEEKDNLYYLLDDMVQYFDKSKANLKINSELIDTFSEMRKKLQELISPATTIKKELPNLEKVALKSRITKSLEYQTPVDN